MSATTASPASNAPPALDYVLSPPAESILCPHCPSTFTGADRLSAVIRHSSSVHSLALKLRCSSCNSVYPATRSHLCRLKPPQQCARLSQTGPNSFLMAFPVFSTQCHLCEFKCSNEAKISRLRTHIIRHLSKQHSFSQPTVMWKCIYCNTTGPGPHLRSHLCSFFDPPRRISTIPPSSQQSCNSRPAKRKPPSPVQCSPPAAVKRRTVGFSVSSPVTLGFSAPSNSARQKSSSPASSPKAQTVGSAPFCPISSLSTASSCSHISLRQSFYPADPSTIVTSSQQLSVASPGSNRSPSSSISSSVAAPASSPVPSTMFPSQCSPATIDRSTSSHSISQSQLINNLLFEARCVSNNVQVETSISHFPLPGPLHVPSQRTNLFARFQDHWTQSINSVATKIELEKATETLCSNIMEVYQSVFAIIPRQSAPQPAQPPPSQPSSSAPPVRPAMRLTAARPSPDSVDASRLQRTFRLNRNKALRQIFDDKPAFFSGDTDSALSQLKNTFCPSFSSSSFQSTDSAFSSINWTSPSEKVSAALCNAPSAKRIWGFIRKRASTAPGFDGVEYRHLKSVDPGSRILAALFSKFFTLNHIPSCLKRGKLIFIHKDKNSDPSVITNFRPIALLSTIYKTFTSILAADLTNLAESLKWCGDSQKGFLPKRNGLEEHIFSLSAFIQEKKRSRGQFHVAFLDLRNAFGSVPHLSITSLVNSLPLPAVFRSLLHSLYEDSSLNLMLSQSSQPLIHPTCGVHQGDPLSPILFNLCLEPVLRALSNCPGQANVFGQTIGVSAFADDIALAFSSQSCLQSALDTASSHARPLNLHFRPDKCHIISSLPQSAFSLSINGVPIPTAEPDEFVKYLGIPLSANSFLFSPPEKFAKRLSQISGSLLSPNQKLEAIRTHLIPSLDYAVSSGFMRKSDLHDLDLQCRKSIKAFLNLPDSASADFFYADRKVGGLGLFSLSSNSDCLSVSRALRILSSNDSRILSIAVGQLRRTLDPVSNGHPSMDMASNYLSGHSTGALFEVRHASSSVTTFWSRCRHSCKNLKASIRLNNSQYNNKPLSANILNPFLQATSTISNCSQPAKALHLSLRERATECFLEKTSQGAVAVNGIKSDPRTDGDLPHFISTNSSLTYSTFKTWLRARLCLTNCRGSPHLQFFNNTKRPVSETLCRNCNRSPESVHHITSSCPLSLQSYTARHNIVQDLFCQLLPDEKFSVLADSQIPNDPSLLRPDLQITSRSDDADKFNVEFSVVSDSLDRLNSAYAEKLAKYSTLATKTYPLIIGCLGSWHKENDKLQRVIGVPKREWNCFRRAARRVAIEESCRIIKKHIRSEN